MFRSRPSPPPRPPRSLLFRLSVRLALVGIVFLVVELSAVVWSYANRPNELDQLLVSAEADRIASDIPRIRADGGVPDDLRRPIAKGTQLAFLIHERGGGTIARFNNANIKVADEAPASFLKIRTQRESWGKRFLLSGTRRVIVADEPFWITVAIAGQGFGPFVPIIYNEIRFHVLLPLLLLAVMFVLLNFSMVRSTLRPLRAAISERMPQGVVYTTFHHPVTGANVVTTEYSDWATNCPEYKVTAVQVTVSNQPSDWKKEWQEREDENKRIAVKPLVAAE